MTRSDSGRRYGRFARDEFVRDGGYQPGLDGVRGVAILLVLGQHAPTRPLIDGYVGVTVFFCLSGYLITTLLVRELQTGTIDVRAFYRRRVARLCPALVAVVAVTIVVLLVGRHDLSIGEIVAPAGAALAYVTSLFDWTNHVFSTNDYFNYTWSLSIEEQFYVLWVFALLWGYRRSPRLFAVIIASFIGVSLALDVYLGLSRTVKYDQHEYFGSDTNALPILVGSLLAIVLLNGWLSRAARYLAPGALGAVALLPALAYRNDTYHPSLVIVAGTGLTLVALVGVVTRPRSAVASLLTSGPMRWLGERSYSIYIWNVLARIAVLNLFGHTLLGDVAWIAMFVVVAEVSYRFVERPLRARLAVKSAASGGGLSAHSGRDRNRATPCCSAPTDLSKTTAPASDEGIERFVAADLHALPVDQLCDRLMPCRADDDVARSAVRCVGGRPGSSRRSRQRRLDAPPTSPHRFDSRSS